MSFTAYEFVFIGMQPKWHNAEHAPKNKNKKKTEEKGRNLFQAKSALTA